MEIGVSEARKCIPDLIDRVSQGETIYITYRGKIKAVLLGINAFRNLAIQAGNQIPLDKDDALLGDAKTRNHI